MEKHTGSWDAQWICADFDCTVCDLTDWKQLERQELLFAWWLISDQQMRSQRRKQMKPFIFSSTLKLFFCSFLFLISVVQLLKFHQSCSPFQNSLFYHNPFFPAFNPLWISLNFSFPSPLPFHTSITAFFSHFSFFPSFFLCFGLWKQALSAGLNSAGPLEARTMGPSSEGSRPMKEEQRPSAQKGPHSEPHSNSLHWPPILCVSVWMCLGKNVCTLACIRRQVLPLGISALWICPPKMAWLSAIILKQAAFSCWHYASIIVQIYLSAWPPVHSHCYVSWTYVY